MSDVARPLLTLVGGIVLAVLLAALLAGSRDLSAVLGPILITTAVSGVVFALIARRARTRQAAEDLRAVTDPTTPTSTTDQEPDRG